MTGWSRDQAQILGLVFTKTPYRQDTTLGTQFGPI